MKTAFQQMINPVPLNQINPRIRKSEIFFELAVNNDGKISHIFSLSPFDNWKHIAPRLGKKVNAIEFIYSMGKRYPQSIFVCRENLPTCQALWSVPDNWMPNRKVDQIRGIS